MLFLSRRCDCQWATLGKTALLDREEFKIGRRHVDHSLHVKVCLRRVSSEITFCGKAAVDWWPLWPVIVYLARLVLVLSRPCWSGGFVQKPWHKVLVGLFRPS